MKKLFLLSVAATLISSLSFAKVWRVNNNPGVVANFTTAQEANDNASVLAGDTIHLEPSIINYGSLNTTKRLTWISIGDFLDIHPNEQYAANTGQVGDITIAEPGAANSVFHVTCNTIVLSQPGVRLERCKINAQLALVDNNARPNNSVIINSYLLGPLTINSGNNIIVTNNIIENQVSTNSDLSVSVFFSNNVINYFANHSFNNSKVENNIINSQGAGYSFYNCQMQYNMSSDSQLPAGNNNQLDVDMTKVFVNPAGGSDAAYVLKAGSPAIGAGSGGVDMGAFGGSSPFKIALQPPIPAIYKIQAPMAPSGNTMNVTFSTRSNN